MISLISLLSFKRLFAYYFDNLSTEQRAAMDWVKENTPKSAKFVILTNRPDWGWSSDNTSEWFPALAERKSITTPQGAEWISGSFTQKANFYLETKACFNKDLACLQEVSKKYNEGFDYVYVQKTQDGSSSTSLLEHLLGHSKNFELIYNTKTAKVFQKI